MVSQNGCGVYTEGQIGPHLDIQLHALYCKPDSSADPANKCNTEAAPLPKKRQHVASILQAPNVPMCIPSS